MFLSSLWLLLCAPNLLWVELGRKEQTKFRDSTAENGASRPRIHGQNPQSITFDGKKKRCYVHLLVIRVYSTELALASGGQNIGTSASASVLPMNIQG